MKKNLFLIILLLFAVILSADFNLGGNIGMEEIGGTLYYSVALTPEARFGKFGMGLDLYLKWNDDGLYPYTADDVLSMIKYVSWGDKGIKPVYARFGILEDAVIGHRFLLNHYQNATAFSIERGLKKLGAQLDIDFKFFGFESITNDISAFNVRGGRFYVRPLAFFAKKGLLSKIAIGASYIEDIDPYESQRKIIESRKNESDQLRAYQYYINIYERNNVEIDNEIKQQLFEISLIEDTDERWEQFRNYSLTGMTTGETVVATYLDKNLFEYEEDSGKKLSTYSIDFEMPILGEFVVFISDMAYMEGYDYDLEKRFKTDPAYLYGFKGMLNLGFFRLAYQIDYRNVPENFTPAIFNSQYEFLKPLRVYEKTDPRRITGYFGDIDVFMFDSALRANISYENYLDSPYDEIYPKVKLEAELNPNLIRNLIKYGVGARVSIEKLNAEKFDLSEPKNTTIRGNLMIDISKTTQIVYEYFRSWDSFGSEVKSIKLYSQLNF